MTFITRKSLLFFAGLWLAQNALAQNALPSMDELQRVRANGELVLQLNVENDSLLLKRDDGFYTSGNQLSTRTVWSAATQSITYGWQIGQDLYTASDIKLSPERILAIDHPYAGWLYLGVFKEFADVSGRGGRLGLDLGCLGPCAGGEWTQTNLHRLLKQPLPQGWSTQVEQEWGAVLSGEWSPGRWALSSAADLSPRLKAHFGNIFTDASLETVLRFGQLNLLPQQSSNYGYLRAEIKAIGYDATLQGGYFANQVLGAHLRRSVGELELGYQWHSGSYGFNAAIVRRSSEIRELSNAKAAQNFAKLQFIYVM
jgi:lipid A 3-O-deacylase